MQPHPTTSYMEQNSFGKIPNSAIEELAFLGCMENESNSASTRILHVNPWEKFLSYYLIQICTLYIKHLASPLHW